jgi:hypothetical protein
MGGGLAADFTLDVRLRFGGKAGGCPCVSFRQEPDTSILEHISHPDSWYYHHA